MSDTSHMEVARLVREGATGEVSPERHWAQRTHFLRAVNPPRRARWRIAVLSFAMSLALAAGVVMLRGRGAHLQFETQTDAATGSTRWVFSDGSQVDLASGATARVVLLEEGGAQIELARGHVDVYVNPRRHARWEVAAGAHTVTVTGTRFLVERGPRDGDVTVQVSEGRVLVHEPHMSEPVVLDEPGERYSTISSPRSRVAPAPVRREPAPMLTFEEEVMEADRARLSGEKDTAEKILLRARARFASGAKGAQIAFRLGRLLEYERPREAAGWYALAIKDDPEGPRAGEAAERRFAVLVDAHDPRARGAAETLVTKFPTSSHADEARRYLSQHEPR